MAKGGRPSWYPDGREFIKDRLSPLTNPEDRDTRERLNWAIYNRGPYSGSENISTWKNYTFNAYIASNNSYISVNPMAQARIQSEIFAKYADAELARMKDKFGADPEQMIEELHLADKFFNDTEGIVKGLNDIKKDIERQKRKSARGESLNNVIKAYEEAKRIGNDGVKELTEVKKRLNDFGDSLGKISEYGSNLDAVAAKAAHSSVLKGKQNYENAPVNFDLAKSIKIEKTMYTSAVNLILAADKMKEISGKIDPETGNLPDGYFTTDTKGSKSVILPKVQSNSSGGTNTYDLIEKERNWEKMTNNFSGMLTNYMGSAYEVATALALETAFGEIFEGAELLGSASPDTKVTTPLGTHYRETTSKRDVTARLKEFGGKTNVSFNISNKNQKKSLSKPTKAYEGQLTAVLHSVLTSKEQMTTLYSGMMNDKFWSASSSMNIFLGAMIADLAIGGLNKNDSRVDFLFYEDAIIPLSSYLRGLKKVNLSIMQGKFKEFSQKPPNMVDTMRGTTITVNAR